MAGRKPKPTVLHELHGNPSKLKNLSRREPRAAGVVGAPEWLSGAQRKIWAHAVKNAPPGVLKAIDTSILAAWVVSVDMHQTAVSEQRKQTSLLVRAPTGYPIQSPYIGIINRQALMMKALAAELGFTPAARPRLGAPLTPPELGQGRHAPLRSVDDYVSRDPTPTSVH